MKKRIGRRLVSLLLTVVTILTMLPAMTLPALAATSGDVDGLAVEGIGLSFTGTAGDAEDPWKASGAMISGSVSGSGNYIKKRWISTLTIKNNKTTKATLSFDYTIKKTDAGTIQVDGNPITDGKSFSKDLEQGDTIKVYIDSGKGAGQNATITMTNVTLVSDTTAAVTFLPAENGSYTVGGKPVTEEYTNTQSATTPYQVVATPAKGYQFMDWYDVKNNKSISRFPKADLNIEKDCTIKARFTTSGLALFETGGLVYDDLTNAITAARGKSSALITQVGDGTISGIYTIPSGVTLLIPFDEAGTLYKATPTATREKTPATKPFRTLTMAAGSSITLENGAAISVGGQYYAGQGGQSGQMVGPYGYIKMESGSAITVKSGASLYAWGFVSGSGAVTVEPSGSVYEWYQILDFRGGTATTNIVLWGTLLYRLFPLSQYTVQNIEVPLTLFKGASETVYAAVYAKNVIYPTPAQFIGNDGMFKLTSGSLTKTYDVSTDRLIYTINGDAEVNSLSLSLAGTELDSSKYVLPFTNNMTVVLKSGSRLTMNQTAALLPSVSVTIEKNAELVVPNGQSMYIYDVDEWGPYCINNKEFVPVPYTPTTKGTRTLTDAKIDINGTLTAIGSVYTTKSGANICSSEGTGKYVQQSKPGTESTTHQATQKSSDITYVSIPITAAQLKNADGADKPYTETSTASAGNTFTYCTCPDCKGKWTNGLQVAEIGATKYDTLQKAVTDVKDNQYIKLLHNTTEDINNITKDIYLDLNGRTVTGDISVSGAYKLYGMDSSAGADYTAAPTGKIVGTVKGCAPTYQTPTVTTPDGDTYDRYVAIPGTEENGTSNLSFHHFNISLTGYHFELATGDTPQCALFFIGKFRGDDAAKKYLTKLGFTLKYIANESQDFSYPMPGSLNNEVGLDEEGAYLFEAYLMRSFDKNDATAYQTKISATAQAIFGTNVGTQNSETKEWSFEDAWKNPGDLTSEQKAILDKFLKELDITNP